MISQRTAVVFSLLLAVTLAEETHHDSLGISTVHSSYEKVTVGVGKACNSYKICRAGLVCESHICKIKLGKSCDKSPEQCANDAACRGAKGKETCVRVRAAGEKCDAAKSQVCDTGLRCISGTCVKPKVKRGGDCLPEDAVCEDKLTCTGTDEKKRCVPIRGPGGRCKEDDPFSVCAAGLTCAGGRCRTPKGASCLPRGSVCVAGTLCRGTTKKKICVTPRGLGKKCGATAFRVCERTLVCEDGVCMKPRIKEAGMCTEKGSRCEKGLRCVGKPRYRLCARPLGRGKVCGLNEFLVCKRGLVCDARRCRTPVRGNCTAARSVCVRGAVCVGTDEKKTCVRPSGLTGQCGFPDTACKKGLLCLGHRCVKARRALGKKCSHIVRCQKGLDCKYRSILARAVCVRVSGLGKKCGLYHVCPRGLRCRHGKCRAVYKH